MTPWSVRVAPTVTLPLVDPNQLFPLSYGGRLDADYHLSPVWELGGAVAYGSGGLRSNVTTLSSGFSEASALATGAWVLSLGPRLALHTKAGVGAAFGMVGEGAGNGFFPTIEAGASLGYSLSPEWGVQLASQWVQKIGLYGGLQAGISFAWNIPTPRTNTPVPQLRLLEFSEPKLGSVYPIFQTYYDDHPVGTIRITNTGSEPAKAVKVTFLVRQYMDTPKDCVALASLAPGESAVLPLYALFRNSILDVTEATKAASQVTVEYQTSQGLQTQVSNASLRVFDRNALTWDDDRKAAAFVSGKDPWVLELSNNITAAVKDSRNGGINKNLQTALAFHNGLRQYGLSYVINPKNPFAKAFENPETVDFVKFPRQTLAYKAGDCSDLSVLYASFLESVGVETAFVTVPGHIFLAVNLDIAPDAAKANLSRAEDLIVRDGKSWMPLEVTMRDSSLVEIWHEAAREWRQASADGTAAFYPVHDAWKTYPPVGLAADNTSAGILPRAALTSSFEAELAKLVDQELAFRLAPLNNAIKVGTTAKLLNARGVLLARYERLADAERDFRASSALGNFAPALINLGNIAYLRSDNQGAFDAYQKAAGLVPNNAKLQINLSRVAQALGKTTEAAKAYAVASKLDPGLAGPYSSLGSPAAESGNRAAEKGEKEPLWDE